MKYYFYKIVCEDLPDYVYVGHTGAFANRKYVHKSVCNNENDKYYNLKVYKTIRDNGGWDNWRMVCIAEEECENVRQAEMVEERYRQELNANMNMVRCYRTEQEKKEQKKELNKEYREENKEEIKKKCKEYRKEHKEELKQHNSKKYTCACGSELRWDYKAKHERTKKHQEFLKTQS
jgi:aminopeptidase N